MTFFENRLEKEGIDDVHYDEEFSNLIAATNDTELSEKDRDEIYDLGKDEFNTRLREEGKEEITCPTRKNKPEIKRLGVQVLIK